MVTIKSGKELIVEQSGWAGIDPYNFLTSSVGPTIAEVPVSTIPLTPESNETLPNEIESSPMVQ